MGDPCALFATAVAARSTDDSASTDDCERDVLPDSERLRLALAAERPAAVANGLAVVAEMASRRHLAPPHHHGA